MRERKDWDSALYRVSDRKKETEKQRQINRKRYRQREREQRNKKIKTVTGRYRDAEKQRSKARNKSGRGLKRTPRRPLLLSSGFPNFLTFQYLQGFQISCWRKLPEWITITKAWLQVTAGWPYNSRQSITGNMDFFIDIYGYCFIYSIKNCRNLLAKINKIK